MIKIILCDDDSFTLNFLSDLLTDTIQKLGMEKEACIACKAVSVAETSAFLNKNPDNYVYFLDLDLGIHSVNGLDFAKMIRKHYPDSKIVFITSHSEKSMNILKSGVEPFGFIEKAFNRNLMQADLAETLQLLYKARQKKENADTDTIPEHSVRLLIGIDEYVTIPVSQIAYVESDKSIAHNICYHTMDDSSVTVRDTIAHALTLLGDDFTLSHRSVAVNKRAVIGYENGQLRLSNGALVTCAIGRKKFFLKGML